MIWQKVLYAAVFAIVLPLLLVAWASSARNNVAIPIYGNPTIGALFVAFGLSLMLAGMHDLWRFGRGLPMNAFPPPVLVSRGSFRYVPHPIYAGFIAICLGVSMIFKSSAGLWLVTPAVALACAGLVLGYEHVDLTRRFGRSLPLLPVDDESRPTLLERVRFLLLVVVPWVAVYEFTVKLPLPGVPWGFPFEERLPIIPWTVLIYESTYLAVALAPWFARTRRELRQLMISAYVATAIVFPLYWFFPSSAPRRDLVPGGWTSHILQFERATYPPVAALPSFHVLWAILVGRVMRPRWLGYCYAAAVAISCVTTGMHYVLDVILAIVVAPVILEPKRLWDLLRCGTERLANSWREWRFGRVRLINHGFYAGAAGFAQVGIVLAAAGPGRKWEVLIIGIAGLVASGGWAQWVEGSSRLRRPFGFYGGLIGVGIACLFFPERWVLLGANCLGAPWTQAIGRLRCLVNGCCHGAPATPALGIRVSHPRSRVTRLAELSGVPIHATQLYSILSNIILGLLLSRLWISHCPLSIVCGVYCIGNGVSRFIEEVYRGEPQTPVLLGLRLYQWIAAGLVLIGAVITTLNSPAPPALTFSFYDIILALSFGLVAAMAMGADFPESNRPLARLT